MASVAFDLGSGKITVKPRDELAKAKIAAAGASASSTLPSILGGDEALFLHTSGTTSRPKGVPLTHSNLATSIKNIAATYEMLPTDRTIIVMPLFHVHGLMCALLATLSAGGAVVLPAGGKFSATSFWDDVIANGVTWYTAVPTIHQILLSRAKSGADNEKLKQVKGLKFIRSCSSSLAPSILHDLEDVFKVPVLEAYASGLLRLGLAPFFLLCA